METDVKLKTVFRTIKEAALYYGPDQLLYQYVLTVPIKPAILNEATPGTSVDVIVIGKDTNGVLRKNTDGLVKVELVLRPIVEIENIVREKIDTALEIPLRRIHQTAFALLVNLYPFHYRLYVDDNRGGLTQLKLA